LRYQKWFFLDDLEQFAVREGRELGEGLLHEISLPEFAGQVQNERLEPCSSQHRSASFLQLARTETGPSRYGYNIGVEDELDRPIGVYEAKVDDKLRIKMPVRFQDALAKASIRRWFIVSLDESTFSMYPEALWAEIKQLILGREAAGQSIIDRYENRGIMYEMDSTGRILLPPQSAAAQRLRNKQVSLRWEDTHILVSEPGTRRC
jgi:DNA-binding transcriptional regulator/RsmH inhibitor MraZ